MATWPRTIKPLFGYQSWQEENVRRNTARSPKFQEIDLWNRTIFMARMRFDLRTDDGLLARAFWKNNRGLSFDFFDYEDDIYIDVLLGTASGAPGQKFVIPGDQVRNWSWKVNGVNQGTAGASIEVGTGGLGQDKLVVAGAQTLGHQIKISYTGKGLFTCVFIERPTKESHKYNRLLQEFAVMERV